MDLEGIEDQNVPRPDTQHALLGKGTDPAPLHEDKLHCHVVVQTAEPKHRRSILDDRAATHPVVFGIEYVDVRRNRIAFVFTYLL